MSDIEISSGLYSLSRRLLGTVCLSIIFLLPCKAHPAIDLVARFLEKPEKSSDFKLYMQSPLRQKLVSEHNIVAHDPAANDASNWSGCQVGKGVLAGTFRDISACAAAACYGRDVTVEEMKNLSYNEAENVIRWIWNQIHGSKISNQSVANLTMHIQMQYGNIRIVQAALNSMGAKLRLSGRMDRATQLAMANACKADAADTYNQIRNQLIIAYGRMRGTYTFVRIINKEFPPKISVKRLYKDFVNASFVQMQTIYKGIAPKVERTANVFFV